MMLGTTNIKKNPFWLFKENKMSPIFHLRALCEWVVTFMLWRFTCGQEFLVLT